MGDSKPRPSYDPPESPTFGLLRQGRRFNEDSRCCNALVLNLGNSLRTIHSALETRFITALRSGSCTSEEQVKVNCESLDLFYAEFVFK